MTHGAIQKRRFDSRCPRCQALERHRLARRVYLQLQSDGNLPHQHVATLHVAPEPCIQRWLQPDSVDYLSIDLYGPAMASMDLTNLALEDNRFSLLWCSHVLEHIPEDRKAIAEMSRVLAPGGVAIVQVPVWRANTYEDPSIVSDEGRLQAFYQRDHVRLYGLDIQERFCDAGFDVHVIRATDFGPHDLTRFGLSYASTNDVFVCRKPLN